jgi:AraC-like DNA-binding protein
MLENTENLLDSSQMQIDPFVDILNLVKAETVLSGGFTAGGSWAIHFPAPEKIKFCVIVKGTCWVRLEGELQPVRAEVGDILLLVARRSFILSSDLDAVPIEAMSAFAGSVHGIAKLGDGEDFSQIGGHVELNPANGSLLANVLPPWVHVRATSPQAAVLQWLVDQLVREQATQPPGASLVSAQLVQLMFVQILRAQLKSCSSLAAGWLRALGDARIAAALRRMHSEPGRSWHLEELAKVSTMSRTTFAVRFKSLAGVCAAHLSERMAHAPCGTSAARGKRDRGGDRALTRLRL